MQRRLLSWYWPFGTTYRSQLQGSSSPTPLKMGSIACLQTSVRNYCSKRRKIPGERRSLSASACVNTWVHFFTYLLTFSPTFCMEHSPSWEANWFSVSQEIPCILQNLKVHYRIHKYLKLVPILSQLDPVHTPTPTSWRSILILSSHLHLGLPNCLFPSGFPTKTL